MSYIARKKDHFSYGTDVATDVLLLKSKSRRTKANGNPVDQMTAIEQYKRLNQSVKEKVVF